nr:hypothetical protein [Tanacetum cinerariifolium]
MTGTRPIYFDINSDGTLTDVRTALDDRLKGIWMKYLPQSIWRKSDKDRAAAMIQAIDKRLKTRRIMRSLESDGTLTDVRTALDDHLKGIRMKYLPQSIWRKSDKDRAAAMIQAIDKRLKTRRIMRSLERFVKGRLHRYSNLMIQPEPEGSTQGYPLVSVEVLRYDKRSKNENMGIVPTEMELILEHTQQGISHEVSVTPTKPGRMTKPYSSHRFIANCFNAGNSKMEVKVPAVSYIHNCMLIPDYQNIKKDESKSSQVIQSRKVSLTYAGNPVKEILLKVESIRSQVNPHGFAGYSNKTWMNDKAISHRFIANCFIVRNFKKEVEVPDSS